MVRSHCPTQDSVTLHAPLHQCRHGGHRQCRVEIVGLSFPRALLSKARGAPHEYFSAIRVAFLGAGGNPVLSRRVDPRLRGGDKQGHGFCVSASFPRRRESILCFSSVLPPSLSV